MPMQKTFAETTTMTDKEVPKLKFRLVDPETKTEWTSGKSWQTLNEEIERLQAQQNSMTDKIIILQEKVGALELPVKVEKVLSLLKAENKTRSLRWIQSRVSIGYWDFKNNLIDTGKVAVSKNGTATMYSLVKVSSEEEKLRVAGGKEV
jgi:hypothetical protein